MCLWFSSMLCNAVVYFYFCVLFYYMYTFFLSLSTVDNYLNSSQFLSVTNHWAMISLVNASWYGSIHVLLILYLGAALLSSSCVCSSLVDNAKLYKFLCLLQCIRALLGLHPYHASSSQPFSFTTILWLLMVLHCCPNIDFMALYLLVTWISFLSSFMKTDMSFSYFFVVDW